MDGDIVSVDGDGGGELVRLHARQSGGEPTPADVHEFGCSALEGCRQCAVDGDLDPPAAVAHVLEVELGLCVGVGGEVEGRRDRLGDRGVVASDVEGLEAELALVEGRLRPVRSLIVHEGERWVRVAVILEVRAERFGASGVTGYDCWAHVCSSAHLPGDVA